MSVSSLRRVRRGACSAALGLLIVAGLASCDPIPKEMSWRLGSTHGAIIEVGAYRASLGIYREPRRGLYAAYKIYGIRTAQDLLWDNGKPPLTTICVKDMCLTTNVLRARFHGYVYGDVDDFRGALDDAQDRTDCLALTLISQGFYIKNWTHKRTGCHFGSLPEIGTRTAPGAPDDGPMAVGVEPADPGDHLPADLLQPAP